MRWLSVRLIGPIDFFFLIKKTNKHRISGILHISPYCCWLLVLITSQPGVRCQAPDCLSGCCKIIRLSSSVRLEYDDANYAIKERIAITTEITHWWPCVYLTIEVIKRRDDSLLPPSLRCTPSLFSVSLGNKEHDPLPLASCLLSSIRSARRRSLPLTHGNCRSFDGAARAWGLGRDRPGCAVETVDRDYCLILSPALWVSHGDATGPHPWISFFSAHPLSASAVRGGQLEGLIILHLKRRDKLLHHMQRTLLLVGPWTVVFRLQIFF